MSDADGHKAQTGREAGEPLAGLSGVAEEIKQLLSSLSGEIEDSKRVQRQALKQIEARITRIESDGRNETAPAPTGRVVPWDLESAEALTKSYEAEDPDFVEEPPYRAPRRAAPTLASAPAPAPAPVPFNITSAPAEMNDEHGDDGDRARLGQRITDFTQRVKRSLADMRPQSSLALLEERIDLFQRRIVLALDDVARRSDVEGLRRIEAHVGDLGGKLGLVHTQLRRMDGIEGQLRTVVDRLSDGRLTDSVELSAAQIEMAARRAAEETHARLSSSATEPGTRYEDLRAAIETSINERQHGERQAITMLETMQQALIEVLDRIEAIEHAQRPADIAVPAQRTEAPAFDMVRDPAPATVPPAISVPVAAHDLRDADIDNGYWSELPADLAIRGFGAQVPRPGGEDMPHVSSIDAAAEPMPAEDGNVSVVERMRRDFIADAQRAKLKAAASRNAQTPRDSGKRRPRIAAQLSAWIGAHTGTSAGRILGVSPKLIVTALVIAVAVNGALIIRMFREPAAYAAATQVHTAQQQTAAPQNEADGPMPGLDGDEAQAPSDPNTGTLPQGALIQEPPAAPAESAQPDPDQEASSDLSGRLGAVAAKANLATLFDEQAGDVTAAGLARSGNGAEKASPLDLPAATVGPLSLRLAAANGDPSAEFEVAARLAEGKGTEQNLEQAVRWYQRAAARGFAQAQYRLATHLERGLGTTKDTARARIWYQRAAEKGNVKAMHNLAVLSAGGDQSAPDYETAVKWFTAASERGLADSQYNLAVLYESGLGVPQSRVQAYKWYKLAAKGGDKDASARCDAMKADLSKADVATGDEMTRGFAAKPTDAIVNDAHAAGEDWKKRANTEANG